MQEVESKKYDRLPFAFFQYKIKVFTDSASWENAQQQCTDDFGSLITINSADVNEEKQVQMRNLKFQENKFFWRTAVSVGIVNGMHIGLYYRK